MPAGQNNSAKTECPKGHKYTEENTKWEMMTRLSSALLRFTSDRIDS